MRKTVIHIIIFSLLWVVAYYGIQFGWGYYQTMNYTPDILNSYSSVDVLQHQVSFGLLVHPYEIAVEAVAVFLLGAAVFMLWKWMMAKVKSR